MATTSFYCICFLFTGVFAAPGPQGKTNHFVDVLLEHHFPNYVKSLHIDPVNLAPFVVQLKNFRYFTADLQQGKLSGLSNALHRHGDCGLPKWEGANSTSECQLTLKNLQVTYDGTARGLDELPSRTNFKLVADVDEVTVLVKFTSAPGQHAALRDRHFGELNFSFKLDVNFGLNEWRKEQFENAVGEHLKHSLLKILYSSYSYALEQSVAQLSLPVPE